MKDGSVLVTVKVLLTSGGGGVRDTTNNVNGGVPGLDGFCQLRSAMLKPMLVILTTAKFLGSVGGPE